jgi:hypothetical protein
MPELASQVTIRSGELNLEDLADFDISPYYQHTAQLQQHGSTLAVFPPTS